MNVLIDELSNKINAQKKEVIEQKLIEKGFAYILEGMKEGSRFTNMCCVAQGNKEKYYVNDGSKDGLLLVTFETIRQEDLIKDGKMSCTVKYY